MKNVQFLISWYYIHMYMYMYRDVQKYSVTVMFYGIFHIKPQFFKTLFKGQFLFDFIFVKIYSKFDVRKQKLSFKS